MSLSRRQFLNTSLSSSTLVAMGSATIPTFLSRSASAAGDAKGGDRVLVVVQLLGGNDGLNTVVPHGIDGYDRGRRALRIPAGQVHKITGGDRPAPFDGGDGQIARTGTSGDRSGGGIPQPGPVAFSLDGNLGDGPAGKRRQSSSRQAGWAACSTRAWAGLERIPPGCMSAAVRCRWP